jgi:hypothetical protein
LRLLLPHPSPFLPKVHFDLKNLRGNQAKKEIDKQLVKLAVSSKEVLLNDLYNGIDPSHNLLN